MINMKKEFGSNYASITDVNFTAKYRIFYGLRVIDINDDLPKWTGHKNHSELEI